MKLSVSAIVAASMLAPFAEACVRVHAYLENDPFTGDVLAMELYDNHKKICGKGKTIYYSSENTEWHYTCEDGNWEVKLRDNGATGEVWNHRAGYHGTLQYRAGPDFGSDCQYDSDGHCRGRVSHYEYVHWDGFGDCNPDLYKTELCGVNCNINENDCSLFRYIKQGRPIEKIVCP